MNVALAVILMVLEIAKLDTIIFAFTGLERRQFPYKRIIVAALILVAGIFSGLFPEYFGVKFVFYLVIPCVLFEGHIRELILAGLWSNWVIAFMDAMLGYSIPIEESNLYGYGTAIGKIIASIIIILGVWGLGKLLVHLTGVRRTVSKWFYLLLAMASVVNGVMLQEFVVERNEAGKPMIFSYLLLLFFCFCSFLLEMFSIILLGSLNEEYKERNVLKNELIQSQQEYIYAVETKDEELRKFRHDIKGHLGVVGSLLEQDEYAEAKEYIGKAVGELQKGSSIDFNHKAVNSIVNYYCTVAKRKGLEYRAEGRLPEHPEPDMYDLSTVYLNILRNAVEATVPGGVIYLGTAFDNDYIYITAKNTYSGDMMWKNDLPVTTKGSKEYHGYGLKKTWEIARKYGGDISVTAENGWFSISVMLKSPAEEKHESSNHRR